MNILGHISTIFHSGIIYIIVSLVFIYLTIVAIGIFGNVVKYLQKILKEIQDLKATIKKHLKP